MSRRLARFSFDSILTYSRITRAATANFRTMSTSPFTSTSTTRRRRPLRRFRADTPRLLADDPHDPTPTAQPLPIDRLRPSAFSLKVYGEPALECDDLLASVAERGLLVPLVVAPAANEPDAFEVLSGHRRLTCASRLAWETIPCVIRTDLPPGAAASRSSSPTTASGARRSVK